MERRAKSVKRGVCKGAAREVGNRKLEVRIGNWELGIRNFPRIRVNPDYRDGL